MKNILVATDFSNNAYCALFYATQLLKSEACTFYLLNTYNELTPLRAKHVPLLNKKKKLEALKTESEERLIQLSHKIVLDNGNDNHHFKTLSKKGDLVKIIKKIDGQDEFHFIVMGNKGLTETADIFFGSNTIKVVHAMPQCPVLTIPGEMDFTEPKEIAFVTDYKTGCHKDTIAPLLFLSSLLKASIRVMHINEEQLLNSKQIINRKHLEKCLENVDHSFHNLHEFDDKAKVIDTFLDKNKIDLFAMVNHKKNLFERLTHEPVIKDVSMYSQVPFLVLPEK